MQTRRSALLLVSALLCALSLSVVGCNGEGEGQPCDLNAGGTPSGTNDCQSPLVCTKAPNPATADGYRCCPSTLSQATTPECTAPTSAYFDANPAPPDAPAETATDTGPSGDANDGAAPADGGAG